MRVLNEANCSNAGCFTIVGILSGSSRLYLQCNAQIIPLCRFYYPVIDWLITNTVITHYYVIEIQRIESWHNMCTRGLTT